MQLCALDSQKKVIFANQAHKHSDYFCLECNTTLRLRGGIHRQNHFYHVDASRECRQNGKSQEHVQAQNYILNLLPSGEASIEYPMPGIGRIADVIWLSAKIVFEIQCSPISAVEVEERNRDYAREGFRVIWILHDKRYNQARLSAAELFLLDKPHYFTNIDSTGQGIIYDQFALCHLGKRHTKLAPLSINLDQRLTLQNKGVYKPPLDLIAKRFKEWDVYFGGDLIDVCLQDELDDYIEEARLKEKEFQLILRENEVTAWAMLKAWSYYLVIRPYRLMFQILLERASR